MRRVALTGWGVISPWADGVEGLTEAVFAGRSAIRALSERSDTGWPDRTAAWIDHFLPRAHFSPAQLATLDRTSQFAVVAGRDALQMAALPEDIDLTRCGVHVGTGMGSAGTAQEGFLRFYGPPPGRLKPLTVPTGMHNAAAAHIALDTGFMGANLTYCCACASAAVAIGEAMRRIRYGEADVMLCGGAEALLYPSVVHAWDALRTLADKDAAAPERSCKPFDARRSGLVLGEGACFFVLEDWEHAEARGAEILAELVGFATGSDSEHLTRPSVAGQARAMRAALQDAHLKPEQVGYINAHGTATHANDGAEAAAIRDVFGDHAPRLPVSSTKAVHGHLMGAAAAIELLIAIQALRRQEVPPTAHLQVVDAECALDHVIGAARPTPGLQVAMSNSFAFGGTTGVLIARRAP